jgi:PHD/YefM family antitoxin component YafN of YafNO toxin-antitoxin module
MTIRTTFTQFNLATVLDQGNHNCEILIKHRHSEEEAAMVAASEPESLVESAYLLRSPVTQNACS